MIDERASEGLNSRREGGTKVQSPSPPLLLPMGLSAARHCSMKKEERDVRRGYIESIVGKLLAETGRNCAGLETLEYTRLRICNMRTWQSEFLKKLFINNDNEPINKRSSH